MKNVNSSATRLAKEKIYSIRYYSLCALCFIFLFSLVPVHLIAQNIGINTTGSAPNASSLLDIDASPGNNRGLLIPRVTFAERTGANFNPLPAAAQGLLVYQTDGGGSGQGFYYNTSTTTTPAWTYLSSGGGSDWLLLGNASTVDGTNFIGTTDNIPFTIRVNNQKSGRIDNTLANAFFGYQAGNSNTTGYNNTANGHKALFSNTTGYANTANGFQALYSNTTGQYNTATGLNALYSNTTGLYNTATGYVALYSNTTGQFNTATGRHALFLNTTGGYNTASGYQALLNNVAGSNATAVGTNAMQYSNNTSGPFINYNVAFGYEALRGSTTASANTGNNNTALGYQTLFSNTTGNNNTVSGYLALYSNTTGYNNTVSGYQALYSNTTGILNTVSGVNALYFNTTGSSNTANGRQALYSNTLGNSNTASGANTLYYNTTGLQNTTIGVNTLYYNSAGSDNVALGVAAGYGASGVDFNQCTFVGTNSYPTVARYNVTMLGYGITSAQCTGDNQVCLGNTSITDIRAAVTGITSYSDSRYKTNIKENVSGLDFILRLKPVTYNVSPRELHKIWGTPDSIVSKMDFSEAEKETRIGFLSQDVEKAAEESGFFFPGIDVPKNDKEVYSLRYVDFIMPMVKAIQELNDSLRLSVKILTEENLMLKAKFSDFKADYENRIRKFEKCLETMLPHEIISKAAAKK